MKRILAAIFVICVGIAAAHAGNMLLFVGGAGNPSVPLVPCTSTGIYDLSNTCNDIYFIGALK